jgi:hypothetical protein
MAEDSLAGLEKYRAWLTGWWDWNTAIKLGAGYEPYQATTPS